MYVSLPLSNLNLALDQKDHVATQDIDEKKKNPHQMRTNVHRKFIINTDNVAIVNVTILLHQFNDSISKPGRTFAAKSNEDDRDDDDD